MGKAVKRPGSSALYYQTLEKGFWAALEAWKQTPKASPSSQLVFQAKFDVFSTKIANFSMLSLFRQTNFTVPDLACLIERFHCILTGRTKF